MTDAEIANHVAAAHYHVQLLWHDLQRLQVGAPAYAGPLIGKMKWMVDELGQLEENTRGDRL